MLVHLLPGVGKTWPETSFPNRLVDADTIFEKAGLDWRGRVHLLTTREKLDAVEMSLRHRRGITVLTNDHSIAESSVVHETLEAYLRAACRRQDLDVLLCTRWYLDNVRYNPRCVKQESPSVTCC